MGKQSEQMLAVGSVSGAMVAGDYGEAVFPVITWHRGGQVNFNLATLPGFEPEST